MEDTNIIILQVSIPSDKIVSSIISTFTPEENYAMIQIGSNAITEARKSVVSLTNKKISEEYKFKINELENEINMEKQLAIRLNERMISTYEDKICKLNEKIQQMSREILEKNKEPEEITNEEIEKIKNKYEMLLGEQQRENILSRETFDRLLVQLNGSTTLTAKGKKGESTFYEIANTFKDFNEFIIQDKHTDAGLGDFHLHFENFDVLVDAKNYKDVVNKKQREKIKNDLLRNEHIEFAWLVSLNSGIAMYDRFPIMHEFINTKQCVIYINNLLGYENPEQILRIVWLFCTQVHKIISLTNIDDDDVSELNKLKNKHYKMYDRIKNMKILIKEINSTINTLKKQVDLINYDLTQILELETGEILETNNIVLDNWWNENIEYTDENNSLSSIDIWNKFKKCNRDILLNFEINYDEFKKCIISKSEITNYLIKNKGGSLTINNHKYKNNLIEIISNDCTMKNDNKINDVKNKKKSTIAKKMYCISEEIDNKIINDYSNLDNDVISIARNNNLEIYQVISILTKHKIINSRMESRGYEIYKNSEEYKLKVNK
jgi:hypothetical protein